eukprot:11192112-Lingulodinium_polyedra.AAC.1
MWHARGVGIDVDCKETVAHLVRADIACRVGVAIEEVTTMIKNFGSVLPSSTPSERLTVW